MEAPTVKDVLLFHKIDRALYEKFVFCGLQPGKASKVVALFMWLEKLGIDIIDPIEKMTDDPMIRKLIVEAEAVLHSLRLDDGQSFFTDLSTITALTGNNGLDIHFFNRNKDLMMTNLVHILDGVGRIVFNDSIYGFFRMYEAQMEAAAARLGVLRPALPSVLAMPFDFSGAVETSTQNERSMLIAFYIEFPITRDEIKDYFTKRWGECLYEILISERRRLGEILAYGKIVFKSATLVSLALKDDNQIVNYDIKGKQFVARKYNWMLSSYL